MTTRKNGTFTFEDTPPDIGEVTYQVFWDGDDHYRRSSASVTVTVRHRSTLTMDGPQSGVVGTAMVLTGVLTAGGKPPSPGATLTVQRSVYVDNVSDGSVKLPPVSVNADGTYTFTDTPAIAGRYSYLALWSGRPRPGRPRPPIRSWSSDLAAVPGHRTGHGRQPFIGTAKVERARQVLW
ncbi:hypothetical protein [Nonomuraea sp. JJY05]|uniref:hypothetical protein n=1 Tax=Nonomuraea sp. JJY05 TaxID=3350255 RepID=UPI00373E7362